MKNIISLVIFLAIIVGVGVYVRGCSKLSEARFDLKIEIQEAAQSANYRSAWKVFNLVAYKYLDPEIRGRYIQRLETLDNQARQPRILLNLSNDSYDRVVLDLAGRELDYWARQQLLKQSEGQNLDSLRDEIFRQTPREKIWILSRAVDQLECLEVGKASWADLDSLRTQLAFRKAAVDSLLRIP